MLRYIVGFAALAVVAATCSDLTAPEGLKGPVTISYQGPPAPTGGVIQLIVGQRVSPRFRIDLGGVAQSRARYFLSLPNLADTNVLRIFGNGDSVEVLGRGNATLEATLVGATVGIALSTRASVNVIATPASNSVDSTSLTFTSLGIGKLLTGSSLRQDGSSIPLQSTSLVWSSADPVIAGVTKLTDSTAIVTSLGNGTTTITATFDGIDVVTLPVTVSQVFARFQMSTAAFGTGEVTLVSLGETITATATPLDANGQAMLAGSQAIPTPNFASTHSGRASVSPVSGVVTAIDNTDPVAPARVYATASGTPRSDSLSVVVRQRATSIVISGQRVDTISSLGATKNYVAVARDANNRDLPPSFISWSTTDQTLAQANAGPPVVVTAIGVGTTRLAASRPADNVGDTITLVISNNPASIELLPTPLAILSIDDTVRFASAIVRNTKGDVLPGAAVTWTSQNPAVVVAMADGRMASVSIGTTTVIATTSNGIADTSQVVVTNAPETLNIIPTNVTLASSGDTIAVAVDFRNSRGVSLPSSSASWSSGDVSVARVAADGSGRIIATGSGDTYVLAVSPVNPLRRDSVLVTVTNAPAAIATSPSSAQTLTAFGQTLQFSATVFNAGGNPIPNAPVRWSVLPGGTTFIAIDSVSGLVTALANGAATVRARSGTITADVSVTVAQAFSSTASTIIPARGSIAADGADTVTVTIQLRDANSNNYVSGGVTVVPSTSRGTLSAFTNQGGGTYTVLLTAGTTSGQTTVAATVNAVAINNSALVTFTPGAATQYVVVILPNASPLAGSNVTVVAQLADQFGNPVTNQVKTVTWSSTSGGTFNPSTPIVTSNGRAIVTFTTSNTPGTVHTLTATDNTVPTALTGSAALVTRSGGPTRYLVTTSNLNPVVGDSVTIIARLVDANGNFERIPGRTVTWTSTGGGGFAAPTSVTDGDGIATVRFGTSTVGGTNHTVTADDGPLAGTSPTFTTVTPTQYLVTANPATASAGNTIFVTAQLADATNNPVRQAGRTVAWTVASGAAVSFTTPTSLTDGNGQAIVALSANTSGNRTIRATDNTALTGVSGPVSITNAPASAALSTVVAAGNNIVANGTANTTVTVTLRDQFGNLVVGKVVSLSDGASPSIIAPASGTSDAAGQVVFTVTDTLAETVTYAATANDPGPITITQTAAVTFVAGSVSNFLVEAAGGGAIATQNAGASFNIRITARDATNNTVTSFDGAGNAVNISSSSAIASGGGASATFTNGVLASHAVTLTTAGTHTITATRAGDSGTSASFTVNPGAAAKFVVTGSATQTAGTAQTVTITAQDVFGNTATGYTGAHNLVFSGANAAPAGNVPTATNNAAATISFAAATAVTFVSGVGTSDVVLYRAEAANIIVTEGAITTTGGDRLAVTVNEAALDHFVVTDPSDAPLPNVVTATPFPVKVVAQDAFNNVNTGFVGTVDFSVTNPSVTVTLPMSAPHTSGVFVGGIRSESVSLTAVSQSTRLVVTQTAGTTTGQSNIFNVTP